MTVINVQRRAAKIAEQSAAINVIRDALRDADITLTAGYAVQARPNDISMMIETIDQWDTITHMRDASGNQLWKDASNTIRAFSQTEFAAFVAEVRQRRAARMDVNFAYAEYMRAQLPLADDHAVFDASNWPGQ